MFELYKFKKTAKRLFKLWGSDTENATNAEMIVTTPVAYLALIRKKSSILQNKYVCVDAVIISCSFAIYMLKKSYAPQSVIDDIKNKMFSAIKSEYSIGEYELERMQRNRLTFFTDLLFESDGDPRPLMEEAALVFAHDLHHNMYIEYTKASPLIIMDIDKQMQIEFEAATYFKTTLNAIQRYL